MTRIAPMAITTQTHTGVAGALAGAAGGAGGASVWKLKVELQSPGNGSRGCTRQK